MADERRVVISSEAHLTPEEVSRRTFATVFRGFDPVEVRAYLRRVSDELGVARERQRHLDHLLAEAQRTSSPAAPLDEQALTAALGEETARVLHTARQAAADIRAKAEENVERVLRQAHDDAAAIRKEAEDVLGVKTVEANEAAEAILADGRAKADAVVEDARAQAREMLEEAKQLRAKVLGETVRRRNVARVQVAQLRAGRERLLDAYRLVRETLDHVTDDLNRADEEARLAAERAGERASADIAAEAEEDLAAQMQALAPELLGEPAAIDLGVDAPEPALAIEFAEGEEAAAAPEPEPEPEPEAAADAAAAPPSEVEATLVPVEPPSEIEEVRIIVPPAEEAPSDEEAPPAENDAGPVDELFAKLRKGRAEAVAKAQQVLADAAPAEAAPANGSAPTTTQEDPGRALLVKRDAELEPLQAQLAKRLKRAMQDEQNDVLDHLRVHKGRAGLGDVLPDAAAQGARYRSQAASLLEQAARAGATMSGRKKARADVSTVAAELADAITGPLRARLDDAFAAAAREDDDTATTVERVGAAYREWKMQRIEGLAADHLVAAFSLGAFAATAPGTPLRWIVQDVDGPCPDCDDNALAGPTPHGEAYPTGQVHPPAHAGCHCLLVAPTD